MNAIKSFKKDQNIKIIQEFLKKFPMLSVEGYLLF